MGGSRYGDVINFLKKRKYPASSDVIARALEGGAAKVLGQEVTGFVRLTGNQGRFVVQERRI